MPQHWPMHLNAKWKPCHLLIWVYLLELLDHLLQI
jgi:hypothetical protein